jgi:nucleoside-diphosphate-sugar epimerase
MVAKLLVFGSGGYLGRHLIPFLARQGRFHITACSSQAPPLDIAAHAREHVNYIHLPLEEFPLAEGCEYDLLLNLACAGVAHKDEHSLHILTSNLAIADRICQVAEQTKKRLLLHFGSDAEQSHLAVYLNRSHGVLLPALVDQAEPSLYSLSKLIQSSLIRYYSARSTLCSHVIMTPNLYGGDDPPGSLLGGMRAALQDGLPFAIRNPSARKRFLHVHSFSSYVTALLDDLLARADLREGRQGFAVSSVDFVPQMSVAAFARRQWALLGGEDETLLLSPANEAELSLEP